MTITPRTVVITATVPFDDERMQDSDITEGFRARLDEFYPLGGEAVVPTVHSVSVGEPAELLLHAASVGLDTDEPAEEFGFTEQAWKQASTAVSMSQDGSREAILAEATTSVWDAVTNDIEEGVHDENVFSFSELHDHTDANMYLVDAMPWLGFSDAERLIFNVVSDRIDRKLKVRWVMRQRAQHHAVRTYDSYVEALVEQAFDENKSSVMTCERCQENLQTALGGINRCQYTYYEGATCDLTREQHARNIAVGHHFQDQS